MRFLLAGVLVGVIAMVVGVGLGVTLEADDAEDFIRGSVLIILPLGVGIPLMNLLLRKRD